MADTFKINGAEYECTFTLSNDDAEEEIKFSKSAIKSLTLEESLFKPFTNANIVIDNPFDLIENSVTLRGDGKDKFTFSLKLKDAPDKEKLDYSFIINNETNMTDVNNRAGNHKNYSLLDDKFFLLNKKIPFGRRYSGKVGDIIKRILKDVVGDDVVDEENWEDGDNEIDVLPQYVIPSSTFKYSDLVLYLLRMYYFKDDDIHVRGLLRFDRAKKKYTLMPITKIYKDNKKLLLEGFGVGDLADKSSSNKFNPPSEAEVNVYTNQLKNTDLSTPMVQYSNEYFVNGVVSGYDPVLGVHSMREVRIGDLKKKWTEKFVDVFSSVGGKPKPFLVLNKEKKEENFRIYSFPYNLEKCKNLVEAEMTSNFAFYNLQLVINNLGNTKREPGKFIDIFKPIKSEGEVDSKLLGRWLVTKVSHNFTFDSYTNTLMCVKSYIGPGKEPDDDAE